MLPDRFLVSSSAAPPLPPPAVTLATAAAPAFQVPPPEVVQRGRASVSHRLCVLHPLGVKGENLGGRIVARARMAGAPLWPSASALWRRPLSESFEVCRFFGCGFGEGGPDSEREHCLEEADSARSSSSSSLGLAPSPVPLPLCRLLSAAISAGCMNGWRQNGKNQSSSYSLPRHYIGSQRV